MATKLIELNNGVLVEVEVVDGDSKQISGGFASKVQAGLERIEPILEGVSHSLARVWEKIERDMEVQKLSVELGISFEGEGNVFITKMKAGANLVVTLELKPRAKSS